ncbi:TPA: 30S ribosomal protein S6 [bacterium UBP9_UBA11836]|nr:30S ribosomal protein S6 [bacterium UBP9_UBA11836]
MRKYEITYILTPDFSEETVAAKVEQYQNQVVNEGGQVVNINNWGKRRFAYEVNGKAEGYYVTMRFDAESAVADELRRVMKNSDEVLRCMVVSVA